MVVGASFEHVGSRRQDHLQSVPLTTRPSYHSMDLHKAVFTGKHSTLPTVTSSQYLTENVVVSDLFQTALNSIRWRLCNVAWLCKKDTGY